MDYAVALPFRATDDRCTLQSALAACVVHQPVGLVAGALDQLAHLGGALAPLPQHMRGDDLRVGRVRPPHAHPDAMEVCTAELALERLEPVVTRQPAAQPGTDVAERQV